MKTTKKDYAAVITDDVLHNFIVPVLEKLTFQFGKPTPQDQNKANTTQNKYKEVLDNMIAERAETAEEKLQERIWEVKQMEHVEILNELNDKEYKN